METFLNVLAFNPITTINVLISSKYNLQEKIERDEHITGQKDCTEPNGNNGDTDTNTTKEQREYSHFELKNQFDFFDK